MVLNTTIRLLGSMDGINITKMSLKWLLKNQQCFEMVGDEALSSLFIIIQNIVKGALNVS